MTHHGHRSVKGQQKQAARRLVIDRSRHDRIRAESVNILTKEQILSELQKQFEGVLLGAVQFERGEVLINAKGTGSLQKT
jgi:hypothetical protein